jgi:hypothetical protein
VEELLTQERRPASKPVGDVGETLLKASTSGRLDEVKKVERVGSSRVAKNVAANGLLQRTHKDLVIDNDRKGWAFKEQANKLSTSLDIAFSWNPLHSPLSATPSLSSSSREQASATGCRR